MGHWVLWLSLACRRDPVLLVGPQVTMTAQDVSVGAAAQGWQVGGTFKRGRGCTVGDFDLDGDEDLLLSHPADPTFFLLNESSPGDLRFAPGPVLYNDATVWNFAAADLEGDGDLDLFANFGGLEAQLFDSLLINQAAETGELTFVDATAGSGLEGPLDELGRLMPTASLEGQWLDYDLDGDLDLWVDTSHYPDFFANPVAEVNGRSQLYRNDGGVWTEIAEEVGLGTYGSARFSSWLDLDLDGDLDLHHNINKQDQSDTWRNDDGTFTLLEAGFGILGADARFPINSFVSATADFNQDGWEDLVKFARGYPTEGPHRLGHTLFLNARGEGFVDATELSNLNDPFLDGTLYRDHETNGVMGATVRDVNGDGIPEVFLGNGGPTGGYPRGLSVSVGLMSHDFGGEVGELSVPVFETMSHLIDVAAEEDPASGLTYPPYPYRGHAICVSDFDGDGLQDVYYMNGGMQYVAGDAAREPNQLFRFEVEPRPRWISVRLHGDGAGVPFTPVGSRIGVTVDNGERRWTVWDRLRTIEGFSAQHGEWRWFGLSDAQRVVNVRVEWTDGTVTIDDDVKLDTKVDVYR
jgi:enediyne biosynthesis protein E4